MPIASLGFRTDIMLLALGGSSITEHDGLTVVATPRTPDFWGGNFVLAPSASALDAAVARHAEMFPEADFVSVGIDGTAGALGIDAAAAGHGLTVERSTALSSTAVCLPPHPNTDAEVRRLHSDEDFEAAADLQYTNDPASGRGFVASRFRTWRRLADEGHGAWFGAFLAGRLCTGLGLYTDGNGVARYQAVDTHPDYRRRELAGTLVHHAGAEGLTWPGVQTLVIVADPGDEAIRVYRSVGFDGPKRRSAAAQAAGPRLGTQCPRGGHRRGSASDTSAPARLIESPKCAVADAQRWIEIHNRTFRHAVCGAPLRSATSPCLYRIDEYDRIRVCRITGALQNSGTQHESAPDNDDSSSMLPDRVYRASESYSATAAGLATLEPSDGIDVSQPTSPPPRRNARRASAAEQTGSEDRSDDVDVDVVQLVPCSSRSAVIFAALG